MRKGLRIALLCWCIVSGLSTYARTTRVYGYVLDEQNVGIEYANVYVQDTANAIIQQGIGGRGFNCPFAKPLIENKFHFSALCISWRVF